MVFHDAIPWFSDSSFLSSIAFHCNLNFAFFNPNLFNLHSRLLSYRLLCNDLTWARMHWWKEMITIHVPDTEHSQITVYINQTANASHPQVALSSQHLSPKTQTCMPLKWTGEMGIYTNWLLGLLSLNRVWYDGISRKELSWNVISGIIIVLL